MCGIAGYVGSGDRSVLEKMTGALVHRGPDDTGLEVKDGVGLGFRRLAIIDLAGGRQPMSNEDGSVTLVFNGEIYNFKELRKELESTYRFTTSSDTEVVLRLYEQMGPACFARLWGMFSIAVWDAKKGRLVLGRDRLGKKPMYILKHSSGLVFGSELKAVLKHPAASRAIDLPALSKYFESDWLPSEHSIYVGIQKLPPAHYGIWENGTWKLSRYWSVTEANGGKVREDLGEGEALKEFDGLLKDATKRRLFADVPLGVFLSGGVDSSLIACAATDVSSQRVQTFSIGFREASFDESMHAREVAARLGTDHHERMLGADEALADFDEIGGFLDEPFADPSVLPTYLLSKITKEQVTVALTGDGGDEVFWGYETFRAHRVADAVEKLPSVVRTKLLPWVVRHLPPSDRYMSLPFVAERFVRGLGHAPLVRDRAWRAAVDRASQAELFRPEVWGAIEKQPFGPEAWEHEFAAEPRRQLAASYLFDYLPNDILYKADRASMAASLEVRSPLLDHRIVEFGWTLPDHLKLKGLTGKYLLKKALEKRLGPRLAYRKKQGFALPTAEWLRGPLKAHCENYFSKSFQDRIGLFQQETINRWWHEHLERKRDHRKCLWSLLMFCRWWERWTD